MTKLPLFISALLITLSGYSQNYKPLIDTSLTWDTYHQSNPGNEEFKKYFLSDTTIMDAIVYHNIWYYSEYYSSSGPSPTYPIIYNDPPTFTGICMREDTLLKKVWVRSVIDTVEHLLYDFTLQPGDTLTVGGVSMDYPSVPTIDDTYITVLDSIGTITLNNNLPYKKFYYTPVNFNTSFGEAFVIEGIGGVPGVKLPFYSFFEDDHILTCVRDTTTTIYNNSFYNYCGNILSVQNQEKTTSLFNISPNPSSVKFTIETEELSSIMIYNLQGQLVYETNSTTNYTSINMENKPKGIYFVKATFNNGDVTTEKLILH